MNTALDSKQIDAIAAQNRGRIVDMIRDLVDIPTENNPPRGFEKEGQAYIESVFREMGLIIDTFAPDEVEGYAQNDAFLHGQDYSNGRKNVVGTWPGTGGGKSLLLTGHMDVAPKEPLPWTVCQPYRSVEKNGRIYGRGSSDMKGGLVAGIMAVRLLQEAGFSPRGSVIVESVVDEEYASGNGTIASRFRGHNADFGIMMEPSGLAVCPSNVGSIMLTITITGSAGMPYTGEEIFNAAYGLADMIGIIRDYERVRENAPAPPIWENAVQKRKIVITKVKAGDVRPHGQLGSPIDALVECSVQTYPGEEAQDIVDEITAFIDERFTHRAGIDITPMYNYVAPGSTDSRSEGVAALAKSAAAYIGDVRVTAAPFPCDFFAYERYGGMPGAIFGPAGGNLHAPDEWVDIDSVLTLTKSIMDMIATWCA